MKTLACIGFLLSFISLTGTLCTYGQCIDTLQLIHFPCCISGIEWSEQDQRAYLVSDLEDKVYVAKLEAEKRSLSVVDSFALLQSPHSKGLEAIRKVGNVFYLVYEKDVVQLGTISATAYVAKANLQANNMLQIQKVYAIPHLPANKGLEGLTISKDNNTIWVAHETLAMPKEGVDSVKILCLDSNLNPIGRAKGYKLPSKSYFNGNVSAYNDYGVTEILIRDDSCYVLERGWGRRQGKGELFLALFKVPLETWQKDKPVWSFISSVGAKDCVDNFEGMCYLPSMKKLLLISDDNQNTGRQRTIARLLSP